MNFIGSVSDTQGTDISPHGGQWGVLADTHGTIGLNSTVDNRQRHLWNEDLCLCDFLQGGLCISAIDADGSVEDS